MSISFSIDIFGKTEKGATFCRQFDLNGCCLFNFGWVIMTNVVTQGRVVQSFLSSKSTDVPFCCTCFSDALHTYFGLCGLSLMEEPGLNVIHAALNITQRAANHLKKLHNQTIS